MLARLFSLPLKDTASLHMSKREGEVSSHNYIPPLISSGEYCMRKPGDSQQIIQQRNYLRNINPRDTVNVNLRKAFLEYDKNLYVESSMPQYSQYTGLVVSSHFL